MYQALAILQYILCALTVFTKEAPVLSRLRLIVEVVHSEPQVGGGQAGGSEVLLYCGVV